MNARAVVSTVATAFGLVALIARAVAVAATDVEQVLKEYGQPVPDLVPPLWLDANLDLE